MTNVREASLWLSYTYLFVRMLRNPLAYGVGWEELTADPRLEGRRYPTPTPRPLQVFECRLAWPDTMLRMCSASRFDRVLQNLTRRLNFAVLAL